MSTAGPILIVDDNPTALYAKTRTLRRAGFDVLEAASGTDALRLVSERRPRLVILDVNLPGLDGWEVCRRIKSDPETASVLVLQVSATYVREEDTVRSLEGGADACLTEPIEPPVLIASVRALLRARHAEDALREALAREQLARATAERANLLKDEFLATLSHELRSPLNAILTWVTLLRTARVDETRTATALQSIERNTRLQVKLIEDLLDVSRIISGKMRLEVAPVDLGAVVEAALDAVRTAADAKGIDLRANVDPRLGPIMGDAARLQQVVWNLVSNAVKFTPKGGSVAVRVTCVDSRAQLEVRDTGRGIAAALLPHVFERFRQGDASTTREEGGLGLGLAIVRHLVELHGGSVEAASPGIGHGATFTVRLPLPAVRGAVAPDPEEGDEKTRSRVPSLRGVSVLVVDDEPDSRDAIIAVLEGSGAHVLGVATVRDGLDAITRGVADVVVSDIAMPGEDGYTFIRALRERRAAVPALALTAYAGDEERTRALGAGYDAYLAKPIEAAELVAAVDRLARSSSQ